MNRSIGDWDLDNTSEQRYWNESSGVVVLSCMTLGIFLMIADNVVASAKGVPAFIVGREDVD